MRGKQRLLALKHIGNGITPADAGKTFRQELQENPCEDHPRGCGENTGLQRQASRARGSPPRMRGKQSDPQAIVQHLGITPADAGKTTRTPRRDGMGRDHPRGCGENTKKIL